MLLKLLTLQTLKRDLKQFGNSKINYKWFFNTLARILPRSGGVSLMSMRASLSRWILNRAPFWTFYPFFAVGSPSILVVCTCRAVFFVKMSEESVIDCGDRLQEGIIVRKLFKWNAKSHGSGDEGVQCSLLATRMHTECFNNHWEERTPILNRGSLLFRKYILNLV